MPEPKTATDARQEELNQYVESWLEAKKAGSNVGLWENPEIVSGFMSAMGRRGGLKRSATKGFGSMSKKRRSEIALRANVARWGKKEKKCE